jgi:hypothetical protein
VRTLLRLARRLYPPAWRARYGDELQALIEERPRGWRDIADVAREGVTMRIRYSSVPATAAMFALAAGVVAASVAWQRPDRFEAEGLLEVRAAGPASTADYRWLVDTLQGGLSAGSLTPLITRFGLQGSVNTVPVSEGLLLQVRQNITVMPVRNSNLVRISYANADPRIAQQVTQELMVQLARFTEATPTRLEVSRLPAVPEHALNRNRVVTASASGAGGGVLLGTMIGLLRRRTKAA